MAKEKVLVINTGGTIGMVHTDRMSSLSPLEPAADWDEIAANYPTLKSEKLGIAADFYQFPQLLDSSNMRYENWQEIAQKITQNYHNYSGFVVLHGTDTMCYTASALSFMFENLAKPVIVTGSQRPLAEARSDAAQNLITSLQIAAPRTFGLPLIPEVCIFFRDHLLRGNRARKLSSSGYSGFGSPNYPVLATAGEHVNVNMKFIRHRPEQEFYSNTFFNTRVMVLDIFPAFDPRILTRVFENQEKEESRIEGLILKTFGAGNVPSYHEFLSAVEFVAKQGVIIVDVTQCPEGVVELGLYEASSGLLDRGVISGIDLTPEAAVCKLMHLLGKGWPREEVARVMQLDLRGEQSLNTYSIEFDHGEAKPVHRSAQLIPGDIDFDLLQGANLRFHNARSTCRKAGLLVALIFLNYPAADSTTPADDPRCAGRVGGSALAGATPTDLFVDMTAYIRKLTKPGQLALISVVLPEGGGMLWEKMTLSLYTRVA